MLYFDFLTVCEYVIKTQKILSCKKVPKISFYTHLISAFSAFYLTAEAPKFLINKLVFLYQYIQKIRKNSFTVKLFV